MPKILIIEDNEAIRENLEEVLELKGYEVYIAENGAIGIEKALSIIPDLIISDIAMPVKNGYDVYESLESFMKEKDIRFMFLTASAQQKDIAKGKVSGADAYVTKPYQVNPLLDLISKLIER